MLGLGSRVTAFDVNGTDIYISGTDGSSVGAVYWKNNVKTSLGTSTIISNDISFYDGDVYTCGITSNDDHFLSKNTVLSDLTFNLNGFGNLVNAIKVVTN